MDLGTTCRADDVGGWTHEDWWLGRFQADWALEVFFLLFNGFPETLDRLVAPGAGEVFFHLFDGLL